MCFGYSGYTTVCICIEEKRLSPDLGCENLSIFWFLEAGYCCRQAQEEETMRGKHQGAGEHKLCPKVMEFKPQFTVLG